MHLKVSLRANLSFRIVDNTIVMFTIIYFSVVFDIGTICLLAPIYFFTICMFSMNIESGCYKVWQMIYHDLSSDSHDE